MLFPCQDLPEQIMAKKPKQPKQPKPEPITLETSRKFTAKTTLLQATNSLDIQFPRVRTVTINNKLSFWTPHLKEYVLQGLRQGKAGRESITEYVKHGNGATPTQYISPNQIPNPFQAMQDEPEFRKQYRDAIFDHKYSLEEQLVTGKLIDDNIRSYESYGSTLIDPASVKLAKLKTDVAIRCLQSIDRLTWAQQRKEEEAKVVQDSYRIYVPKRENT
jgi:hypothetical protein